MSSLFNEREADQEAIKSLTKEIRRLTTMSKILKDENGTLYLATSFDKLNAEQAQDLLADRQSDVALLSAAASTELPANDNGGQDNGQDSTQTGDQTANGSGSEGTPANAPSAAPQGPQDGQATPPAPTDGQVTDPNAATPPAPAAPAASAQPEAPTLQ